MVAVRCASIFAFVILTGCVSRLDVEREAVCRDGFKSTREGVSRLYAPSDDSELQRIEAAVLGKGRIVCIHRMPNSDLHVITWSNRLLQSTQLRNEHGVYSVLEEGFIIGH